MEPFQKTNRSAYANFLHSKYEMYSRRISVRSHPYYLGVDPSDLCQLRCPTCPTGIENENRRSNASQKEIFRKRRSILSEELLTCLLDELGEYLFLMMFYNYGEPLLNKRLPALIRQAKAFDIETEVHTNLSLPLSDGQIDDLLTSGLDRLHASVDGFRQQTYEMHRVGGDVELVKNNLERLAHARDRLGVNTEIAYNYIVFSFNEQDIEAAAEFSERIGILFHTRDAFTDDPDWLPVSRKREEPWFVPEKARIRNDRPVSWSPLPRIDVAHAAPACGWHYGYSIVTAGGPVAPCCAVFRDENDFGTVVPGEVGFGDIWNNRLFRKSRADFAGKELEGFEQLDTICTQCPYPKGLQHLYSVNDIKVIAQFKNALAGMDPNLDEAFEMFSRIRYGLSTDELLANGVSPPFKQLLAGYEDNESVLRFTQLYERHFGAQSEMSPIQVTTPPAAT